MASTKHEFNTSPLGYMGAEKLPKRATSISPQEREEYKATLIVRTRVIRGVWE